ncbi:hypothetical protein N7501_007145 [Penicillium viridicatum]|nr:hypothetical protein N7501_007145 [Penicillium viridicatum]
MTDNSGSKKRKKVQHKSKGAAAEPAAKAPLRIRTRTPGTRPILAPPPPPNASEPKKSPRIPQGLRAWYDRLLHMIPTMTRLSSAEKESMRSGNELRLQNSRKTTRLAGRRITTQIKFFQMDMTFKHINGPITEVVFGTKDVVLNRACILARIFVNSDST